MIYTSSSIALALLETVVHLGADAYPLERYAVEITLPDDEFGARRMLKPPPPHAWERNLLVNPLHPASKALKARNLGEFVYDLRLLARWSGCLIAPGTARLGEAHDLGVAFPVPRRAVI